MQPSKYKLCLSFLRINISKSTRYWKYALYDKQKWFVYVMAIKVEYRPETVKLPPNFCKTLEKIVKNRLCEHISTHGLQSTTQLGFWERRSCATQVSTIFPHWSETLDKRNPPRTWCYPLGLVKTRRYHSNIRRVTILFPS